MYIESSTNHIILIGIVGIVFYLYHQILEICSKNKSNKIKTTEVMEKININTASAEDLTKIKHIGKKRAEKIIKRRPYKDIFELSNVLGLGHKRMTDIINEGKITI